MGGFILPTLVRCSPGWKRLLLSATASSAPPAPPPAPQLWLAEGRALDPRCGRADRERLRTGGQDRPDRPDRLDRAILGAFHRFLTGLPSVCRQFPDTVFRLDALHHLLGAPPKGARGAAEGDPPLGDRRGRVLLAL